jgi:hypothetical protein
VRPLICRALGASPALPCHYGCKLPKKAVSSRALKRLFQKVESFGGPNVNTHPELSDRIRSVYPLLKSAGLTKEEASRVASAICYSDKPTDEIVSEIKELLAR